MENRKIKTNLIKKEDVFKFLALAEATNLAMLLIGPPGTAKTATVVDYAKAAGNGSLSNDDLFVLETDEGTKSTAIKGNIDLEELTLNQKYKIISPITDAKFVIINEVDKASATLRNSLLSVMNEKVLFTGKDVVPCNWNVFVATCNKIPEDEKDSPFWDRFLIKLDVNRVRQSDLLSYFDKGDKNHSKDVKVNIPTKDEVNAISLDPAKLKKIIDTCYDKLSDRTLSYLPTLIKTIMLVYGLNEAKSMIKAVELLVNKSTSNELSKILLSKEQREIYDKIDMISSCVDADQYESMSQDLITMIKAADAKGLITPEDTKDINSRYEEAIEKLAFLEDEYED